MKFAPLARMSQTNLSPNHINPILYTKSLEYHGLLCAMTKGGGDARREVLRLSRKAILLITDALASLNQEEAQRLLRLAGAAIARTLSFVDILVYEHKLDVDGQQHLHVHG